MKKRNWFLVIIVIIAALLIASVIWIYSKRIKEIEKRMKNSPTANSKKLSQYTTGSHTGTDFPLPGPASI